MANSAPFVEVKLLSQPVTTDVLPPNAGRTGGECIFLGRTRAERHPRHGELLSLHYEAYQPMAEHTLRQLADAAAQRFGCLAVRVYHALGEVPLGDASVLVQVACAHRGEAFDACRFLIDRLKAEAPIWKQERWSSGSTWSAGAPVSAGGERQAG